MHQLSTMLLLWVGVSATGLAAAVLMVAVVVCTTVDDFGAGAEAPACKSFARA